MTCEDIACPYTGHCKLVRAKCYFNTGNKEVCARTDVMGFTVKEKTEELNFIR